MFPNPSRAPFGAFAIGSVAMKRLALALALAGSAQAAISCGSSAPTQGQPDAGSGADATTGPADEADGAPPPLADAGPDADAAEPSNACVPSSTDPVYAAYAAVDPAKLLARLKESTGVAPVDLGDAGVQSITNRYTPQMKAYFRAYFEQQMTALGIAWQELPFPTVHTLGETEGHDVEAVLPGASPDSVVVIVHYDSTGPAGNETSNPGVDDDATGLASLFEAARVLSSSAFTRDKTLRFVASDYEEIWNPTLEGARYYAKYIQAKAASEGWKLVAAVDYEQSGWNCSSDKKCGADVGGIMTWVADCSGGDAGYAYPELGKGVQDVAARTCSPLKVITGCQNGGSDNWALWEIGVPSLFISEMDFLDNHHFDQWGGDVLAIVDPVYHAKIARLSIAFTAQLAGARLK
jgi:hypothetical protein